ncbi:MAG: helix-turn-helix domain-containing protein [Steroidobacteraceae bacterium]
MKTRPLAQQRSAGFAARLRERLERFGSAAALALAIQRSESAVRKWLRGQSEPNVTDLRAICEVTQTRLDWLVSGHGAADQAEGLREPDPRYGVDAQPLDLALLERVLEAIEAHLRVGGATLPSFKHAALVATCYDLSRESGRPDAQVIARLVKLAG